MDCIVCMVLSLLLMQLKLDFLKKTKGSYSRH